MTIRLARALRNAPPTELHVSGDSWNLGHFVITPVAKEYVGEAFKRFYGNVRFQRLKALSPDGRARFTRAAIATAPSEELATEIANASRERAKAAGRREFNAPSALAAEVQKLKWAEERRRNAERAAHVRNVLAQTRFPCAQSVPSAALARNAYDKAIAAADKLLEETIEAAEATMDAADDADADAAYQEYIRIFKEAHRAQEAAHRAAAEAYDTADKSADTIERENAEQANTLRAFLTAAFVGTWDAPDPQGVKQLHFLLTGAEMP
jgi:hypothetical protein